MKLDGAVVKYVVISCHVGNILARNPAMKAFVELAKSRSIRVAIVGRTRDFYLAANERKKEPVNTLGAASVEQVSAKNGLVHSNAARSVTGRTIAASTGARKTVTRKTRNLHIALDHQTLSTTAHAAKPCLTTVPMFEDIAARIRSRTVASSA